MKEQAPSYEELRLALQEALEHLDYCSWGDAWERECADEDGLRKRLPELLDRATRLRPPKGES